MQNFCELYKQIQGVEILPGCEKEDVTIEHRKVGDVIDA